MIQGVPQESKNKIATAFAKLLEQYNKDEAKIATKEEEVEKEKNQQLLETASNYTVDNIVNGMATLQLDFGNVIQSLSTRLIDESEKLDELKKALAVEKEHLEQLKKIRLAADALHLLRQEHLEKIRILEHQIGVQREVIDKEIIQTRKNWTKSAEELTTKAIEAQELIIKQREQEQADYQYELARIHQIENDEYEETRRLQERELNEQNREKEKDWTEREKFLTEHQQELRENEEKIAGFENKLNEEYNKAKGEAIKEAERQGKVRSDLLEKEWEANKQGYELKIQSLESIIEKNNQQISELAAQLQTVTTQAQNLAMRAFSNNN